MKQEETLQKDGPARLVDSSSVTIIYTSGTSGDAKGVALTAGNITFMLQRTTARLVELMEDVKKSGDDRVFHYLPFCFAGSWILLLTTLYRNIALILSTDLNKLAEELRIAQPHYLLNVPALLERMRKGIQDQLRERGRVVQRLFAKAQSAWLDQKHRPGWNLRFAGTGSCADPDFFQNQTEDQPKPSRTDLRFSAPL